ncbi:hypothetical protein [Sphingomonas soli]|uniref:hypothetical protein n=1 Tax=Sphingomonas soli TaxID=266127 RepID=UPI000A5E4BCB|nr:hypothetical protein [Sphingomonas soli]
MKHARDGTGPAEDPHTPHRPYARIAVRGVAEFVTHFCAALTRRFEGDIDLGLIFVHLLRRADLSGTGAGAMAPTSISALARSAGRPFETVRRLCKKLVAMGLAEQSSAGPFIPAHVLDQPMVQELRQEYHDNLVKTVSDLARVGYPMPEARGDGISGEAIERAAIDLLLHAFEFGLPAQPTPNWQRAFVYIAVMAANARRYTFDPELSGRYKDAATPPPDHLRTPVGASALARATAAPYSTVRRNLQSMIADGILVRAGHGYLISMEWMQRPELAAAGAAVAAQLDRAIRGLAQAGFPISAPETAYWRGPPRMIAFT